MRFGARAAVARSTVVTTPPGQWSFAPGSWQTVFEPASGFTQGLAIDPNNPNRILFANIHNTPENEVCGIWEVTPSGQQRISGPGTANGGPGQPIVIAFPDPSNSDLLVVADGVRGGTNGIWRTTNRGQSWAHPGDFASVTPVFDMYHVAVEPGNPLHMLATYHSPWPGDVTPGILRTTDGGTTWSTVAAPPGCDSLGGHAVHFVYNPGAGIGSAARWLYHTQDDGMWLTTDSGSSWAQCTPWNMDHGGGQIVVASNGDIYSSAQNYIMRSTDLGASWTEVGWNESLFWLTICTDGTKLYTQSHSGNPVRQATIPATQSSNWTALGSATIFDDGGSFQLAYDPVHNRLWNASLGNGLCVYQF